MRTDDTGTPASDARDEMTERAGRKEASPNGDNGETPPSKVVLPLAGLSPEQLRDLVPREILEKAISDEVVVTSVSRRYSGPLPPAQALSDYEKLMPGCGKIIIDNFAANGAHRREREKRGQHYAMLSLFLILAVILGCAYVGESWIGSAVAVTGLGGLFLVARVFGVSRSD